jgi:YVTN family beta-propeller protein
VVSWALQAAVLTTETELSFWLLEYRVWVAGYRASPSDGVGEVTAAGSIGRSLALPDPPGAAVAADGSVWVTSPEGNAVYRIDPVTATITQSIPVGSGPSAITATGPDIWVANTLDGTVSRSGPPTGGTLRVVVSVIPPTSIDPALLYPWAQAQFSDATYDTLVTFQKTGGSSGLQLVPTSRSPCRP